MCPYLYERTPLIAPFIVNEQKKWCHGHINKCDSYIIYYVEYSINFFVAMMFNGLSFFRFRLSSDTDVRNIVDQWKRNHATTDQKGKNNQ